MNRSKEIGELAKKLGAAGLRKAAILLVSLEPDLAAKVLEQVGDRDLIERLSVEIARLDNVSRAERDKALEEFYNLNLAHRYVEQGGMDYAKSLIEKVLPPDESGRVMETIQVSVRDTPFAFLQKAEPESLLTFLQEEHPQTIALILAHLAPSQAAAILGGVPAKKQVDVIRRLATMQQTSPEIVSQVEGALQKKMSAVVEEELKETGGVTSVANILNLADRATERTILESLEEEDPDLVDKIRRLMFIFDDVLRVNDRGIQALLKEIDREQLALALRTANPELKDKFFKNMSKNASNLIKEEMEYMGPVRLADVENAQQQIMDIVRKLEEAGEVIIQGRSGEEEIIV